MSRETFGGRDKYYSAFIGQTRSPRETEDSRMIKSLLGDDDEGFKTVDRTFRQWNLAVREQLRAETGLRLSAGDDIRSVPVRISDGLPVPLATVVSEFSASDWEFLLNRPLLDELRSGLTFLEREYDRACDWLRPPEREVSREEIVRVEHLVRRIVGRLEEYQLEEKMRGINQDFLGAYFYGIPQIRLYWMAIALTARFLALSVEALAFVVIAHELAHAYSHLGRDIDGRRWETSDFAETDIEIVEGLAQYYTGVICDRVASKFPSARQAYEKLLQFQSPPYRIHDNWPKDRAAGETVRLAMITARSTGDKTYSHFANHLTQSHLAVSLRKASPIPARATPTIDTDTPFQRR